MPATRLITRVIKGLDLYASAFQELGPRQATRYMRMRTDYHRGRAPAEPSCERFSLKARSLRHPCQIRPHSTDLPVLQQILLERNYALPLTFEPEVIFDLGANIGLSSLYFASRYPQAMVLAVEPEAGNFELLQANAEPYPNIQPCQAGVWRRDALLAVRDKGIGSWGFVVEEVDERAPNPIRAFSIPSLLHRIGRLRIDILKIDIEGSEKEVFEGDTSWLGLVRVLIIELHDGIKPGCSEAFYKAIEPYGFRAMQRGENVVLFQDEALKLPRSA